MDFTFSADQDALRDTARAFLADRSPSAYVREMADDERGFTDDLWNQIVDLGWTGILVPEEQGGLGLGLVDAVVILEEMGRVPFPGPYFSSATSFPAADSFALASRSAAAAGSASGFVASVAAGSAARALEANAKPKEKLVANSPVFTGPDHRPNPQRFATGATLRAVPERAQSRSTPMASRLRSMLWPPASAEITPRPSQVSGAGKASEA